MTKLEDKLIELGYEKNRYDYRKDLIINDYFFTLIIDLVNNKVFGCIGEISSIIYQCQLDGLQQAFNQLQKDLEVLKECI